jgi:uncharacterized protein (TIGR00369 family)
VKTLQPNSRHCFVCGLENPFGLRLRFYETAPGEVSVECSIPEEYQGYPGVVHGGVVAAILDEAAGRSQMQDDPPRFMFTARLDIRYRKNVPVGQPLRLVGTAGASKRRTAAARSAIYDQEGNLLAEAEALLVNVPDDIVQGVDLEALGWRVYSETEVSE